MQTGGCQRMEEERNEESLLINRVLFWSDRKVWVLDGGSWMNIVNVLKWH